MADALDKVVIEFQAKFDDLNAELAQAEAKVKQSAVKMESAGSEFGKRFTNNFGRAMLAGIGAFAIDRALEDALKAVDATRPGHDVGIKIAEGVVEGIRATPIAGPIGEILARSVVDPLTGGSMQAERLHKYAAEQQGFTGDIQNHMGSIIESLQSDQMSLSPEQQLRRRYDAQFNAAMRDIEKSDIAEGGDFNTQTSRGRYQDLRQQFEAELQARSIRDAALHPNVATYGTALGSYTIGQSAAVSDSPQQKQVDILQKIEENTRPNDAYRGTLHDLSVYYTGTPFQ